MISHRYKMHWLLSSIELLFQGQWQFWALSERWHMQVLSPTHHFGNCEAISNLTKFNMLSSTGPNVLHATFILESTYCTNRLRRFWRKESLQLPLGNGGKQKKYRDTSTPYTKNAVFGRRVCFFLTCWLIKETYYKLHSGGRNYIHSIRIPDRLGYIHVYFRHIHVYF